MKANRIPMYATVALSIAAAAYALIAFDVEGFDAFVLGYVTGTAIVSPLLLVSELLKR